MLIIQSAAHSFISSAYKLFFCLLTSTLLVFNSINAQDSVPADPAGPGSDDKSVQQSVNHMLRRAQLTRALAAEHLIYIKSNRDEAEVRIIEDATQVMAFNLICEDEKITPKVLNQIATDTSFKIAMMAGRSTISEKLAKIAARQSIEDRMELIGDVATTVLMFEIGRRRGLFDALLTDFGQKRFCKGIQADMRTRYNGLANGIGQ